MAGQLHSTEWLDRLGAAATIEEERAEHRERMPHMEPSFSYTRTLQFISSLAAHQQLAVGAACCERMLPNYAVFLAEEAWGDLTPLRAALDAAWDACMRGTTSTSIDIDQAISQCSAAIPDGDTFSSLHVSAAQDAACSVCLLLGFLRDLDPERIARILRFSTDSVDLIVQELDEMDTRDPKREQKILQHPLMQQELVRQRRDLSGAGRIPADDQAALAAFRQRAATERNLDLVPAPA